LDLERSSNSSLVVSYRNARQKYEAATRDNILRDLLPQAKHPHEAVQKGQVENETSM